MATRVAPSAAGREERFFFLMACVMAAVVVTGFGANVATGRVTFAAQPWYAHLHAFVFFGWMALYVVQNGLVATGNVALHRRLGWLALAWAPTMVVLGAALIVNAARWKEAPPEAPSIIMILIGNLSQISTFAILVFVAIALRRRTAAHRRLMFVATSLLTVQAVGRLAPMLITPGPAIGAIVTGSVLLYSVAGALHDKWLLGRVHPVWWLGMALQPFFFVLITVLPTVPGGNALLHLVLDGSPGAAKIPPLP